MGNRRCTACGAPLADDAVICLKCGRVAGRQPPKRPPQPRPSGRPANTYPQQRRHGVQQNAAGRQPQPRSGQQRSAYRQPSQPRPQPKRVQRPVYDAPPPEVQAREARGSFRRSSGVSGKIRLAARCFAAALLIAVIYICGSVIQTTRVRMSTYSFKSSMKMTYSSYGKAMDNYFEEGHWSANLFTGNCTYIGKNKHGEEYKMVFGAGVKIKLKSITVDGEPIEKDMIETKVMGMFI